MTNKVVSNIKFTLKFLATLAAIYVLSTVILLAYKVYSTPDESSSKNTAHELATSNAANTKESTDYFNAKTEALFNDVIQSRSPEGIDFLAEYVSVIEDGKVTEDEYLKLKRLHDEFKDKLQALNAGGANSSPNSLAL